MSRTASNYCVATQRNVMRRSTPALKSRANMKRRYTTQILLVRMLEVNVSAGTLRGLGFLLLVAAAVVAILNLKRVANLGMIWLVAPLLIAGAALMAASRRRS